MNPQLDGNMYVRFTNPVTGEDDRVPRSSAMGRAVLSGDTDTVVTMCNENARTWARQIRLAEMREEGHARASWPTIAAHAAEHGREFRVLLMAVAP